LRETTNHEKEVSMLANALAIYSHDMEKFKTQKPLEALSYKFHKNYLVQARLNESMKWIVDVQKRLPNDVFEVRREALLEIAVNHLIEKKIPIGNDEVFVTEKALAAAYNMLKTAYDLKTKRGDGKITFSMRAEDTGGKCEQAVDRHFADKGLLPILTIIIGGQVKFKNNHIGPFISNNQRGIIREYDGFGVITVQPIDPSGSNRHIPLCKVKRITENFVYKNNNFTRSQFPLENSIASTVQSIIGLTFTTKTLFDNSRGTQDGTTYVIFSRNSFPKMFGVIHDVTAFDVMADDMAKRIDGASVIVRDEENKNVITVEKIRKQLEGLG